MRPSPVHHALKKPLRAFQGFDYALFERVALVLLLIRLSTFPNHQLCS